MKETIQKHSTNNAIRSKYKYTYYHKTDTIVKTPTHYKTHTYTHPYITKQVKTTTVQDKSEYEGSEGRVINRCQGIVRFNRCTGHGLTQLTGGGGGTKQKLGVLRLCDISTKIWQHLWNISATCLCFLQLYWVPLPVGKDQKLSVLLKFHYLQAALSALRSFSSVLGTWS
jgi:hypothetical protein